MSGDGKIYLVPLESGFLVPLVEGVSLVEINKDISTTASIAHTSHRHLTLRKIRFYEKHGVCYVERVQALLKQYNNDPSKRKSFDLFLELIQEAYRVLKPLTPNEWFWLQFASTVTTTTGKTFIRKIRDTAYNDHHQDYGLGRDAYFSQLLSLSNAMRPIESDQVSIQLSDQPPEQAIGLSWYRVFENLLAPVERQQGEIDTRFIHIFINTVFGGRGFVNAA